MAQITYENKVALNENPNINAINKVQDTDMNQIKEVVNENETKILLAVTDTEPTECSTGDMYYNTTDDLIYTATATDTWSSTGVAPTENTLYVVLTTQTSYMYDGNTLISVGGGGGGGIAVYPDEPEEDTKLYIESTDLDGQYLPIEEDVYSTSEVKTNKVWIDGKPIYRKVIDCGALPNNSGKFVNHNLTNVTIINYYGIGINPNGNSYILPYSSTNGASACIEVLVTSTQISLATGTDRSAIKAYVVLEYTKTTD